MGVVLSLTFFGGSLLCSSRDRISCQVGVCVSLGFPLKYVGIFKSFKNQVSCIPRVYALASMSMVCVCEYGRVPCCTCHTQAVRLAQQLHKQREVLLCAISPASNFLTSHQRKGIVHTLCFHLMGRILSFGCKEERVQSTEQQVG